MWSCNSQRHQKYLKMFIFQKVTKTQIKSLLILLIVFLSSSTLYVYLGRNPRRCDTKKNEEGFLFFILHYWFRFNFSCVTTDDYVVDRRLTPYAYNVALLKLKWIFIAWCTCNLVLFYCFEVRGGLTWLGAFTIVSKKEMVSSRLVYLVTESNWNFMWGETYELVWVCLWCFIWLSVSLGNEEQACKFHLPLN